MKWCQDNNLSLNVNKTKEMIVDPRVRKEQHSALVKLVKKSHQHLHSLKRLKKFGMSRQTLSNFYRCAIKSILTSSIIVRFGSCTVQDCKALQRLVKSAQAITGTALPALESLYQTRTIRRATNIIKDNSHPQHSLF